MSFYQTADPVNFSVYPSRDQRAPYGTVHNIPIIQAIDQYAESEIPVTLMKDGTLVVLQGNFEIALPGNTTFFKFLGGHKYISNGDVQNIEVIQRGTDPVAFYNIDNLTGPFDVVFPGHCHCLTIQWTTEDEAGNRLPVESCYYTILPSNFVLLGQQRGIDVNAKLAAFPKKIAKPSKLAATKRLIRR